MRNWDRVEVEVIRIAAVIIALFELGRFVLERVR
jgi:hypothetical protein